MGDEEKDGGTSAMVTDAMVNEDKPQIQLEFDKLSTVTDILQRKVLALKERLTPILGADRPEPASEDVKSDIKSSMAQLIEGHKLRIDDITGIVSDMISKLEI